MAYFDKHGVEYSDDKKTLVRCPDDFEGEYVIPEGVTAIGNWAFSGCSNLKRLTIPRSVKSIEWGAFTACEHLEEIYYSGTIEQWCLISWSELGSNINLHDLYIQGEKVVDLTIPDTIQQINAYAFKGCTGLTSVTIPNSVTCIGNCAFKGCTGLTSVTIPNSVTSIGEGAFYGCTGLTSVTIPNSVTSIGTDAFSGCHGLKSVTIPDSVTSIGGCAFEGCTGLKSVTIPDSVTSIGDCAFKSCHGLAFISLGKGISHIGVHVFYGSNNLRSITFSDDLKEIADGALREQYHLQSLTIPAKFFTPKKYPDVEHSKDYYYFNDKKWTSQLEASLEGRFPPEVILCGSDKHLDFRHMVMPPTIYCASKIESIILPEDFITRKNQVFISNYIEDVNVVGIDKWKARNLFFLAPKPSTNKPHQKTIELILAPRSSFIRYYNGDDRWSCPITVDINAVTYVYPIEMTCYQKNYLGSRLLLCGPSTNESYMEYLKKTESYPFIDVWEPYDIVCSRLKQGGWVKCTKS